MKTKKSTIIACIITALFVISILTIIYRQRTKIITQNIYVCDNKSEMSQFDLWIKDKDGVDVDWVPTYIIIKNKTIIGKVRGTINEKELTNNINNLIVQPTDNISLNDTYKITNLNNESNTLNEIIPDNDLYLLEILWIDCPDCIEQEETYENQIVRKYTSKHIYKYYMKTDRSELINKVLNEY